jgi:hypothetical protein
MSKGIATVNLYWVTARSAYAFASTEAASIIPHSKSARLFSHELADQVEESIDELL